MAAHWPLKVASVAAVAAVTAEAAQQDARAASALLLPADARVRVHAPARARGFPWARPSEPAVVAARAMAAAAQGQATDFHAAPRAQVPRAAVASGSEWWASAEPAAPVVGSVREERLRRRRRRERPAREREPLVLAGQPELTAAQLHPVGRGRSAKVLRRARAYVAPPSTRRSAGRTESPPATARRARLRPPQGVTRLWGPPHLNRPWLKQGAGLFRTSLQQRPRFESATYRTTPR